ncbi:PKD domain-containing protein [bacterium]|nr:MAG: PKD domain-containing protein [bacterium]
MNKTIALFTLLLSMFIVNTAFAITINVPGDYPTIQAGINASVDGDTVLVQPGTYVENINYNGKNITVGSLFLTTLDTTYISQTVIDGNNIASVVTFEGGENLTAVLVGFNITNGQCGAGGGITCIYSSSPSISNVTIAENSATDTYGGGGGIHCYSSSPSLTNVTITGNSASSHGGGIFCRENSSPSLTNVTITGNSADKGGGIYCHGSSPSLTNVTITENSASDNGGGIYCSSSSPSLTNVTITENSASAWGGGIYCHGSSPSLPDVTITGNSADKGGGIYCDDSSPSLTNVTITGNSASSHGGGISCLNSSSPSLTNVTITGNSASSHGGGIFCYSSSPSLTNVTITENFAYDGGGISCLNYSSPSLTNVTITGNSASSCGGGIYCQNSSPSLSDVTITGNSASAPGGGIYCYFSSPSLTNVTITENSASGDGGGIYCHVSSPSLSNVTITGNSAFGRGGGIYCYYYSPSFNSNNRCNIYLNNVNNRGSGSDIYSSSFISVIVDTFTVLNPTDFHASPIGNFTFDILHSIQNQVDADLYVSTEGDNTNSGLTPEDPLKTIQYAMSIVLIDSLNPHTIYLSDGIYSTSTNEEFFPINIPDYLSLIGESEENVILDADSIASVIRFIDSDNCIVSNLTIKNGSAYNGGGIYCDDSSPSLTNVNIMGNSAAYKGGGIYCGDSSPSLTNVTITENSASNYGGGIHCWNSSPSLDNVTITENFAYNGGGIYCDESSPSLINSIVSDNNGNYGIYVYSGNPTISYSDFWNNEGGNFYNCDPQVGVNVTTNANGDDCDVYYNIQMNPLFVDPLNGDYHLTENSPCIDAGNPDPIYFDPDGTISDIGAYYYDQLPYFPNADFTANITNGIFPLIVDFTDLSTMGLMGYPIIEWEWDFNNDGTIDSYEQNPQWTYTEAGLYTVKLTVSDGSNTGTETKVDYITVLEPIGADFEAVPLLGLAPLDVQFTDLSTGGLETLFRESKKPNNSKIVENDNSRDIVSWEWDFNNDGTIDSYLQNPLHTYPDVGIYTVSLTVSDGTNEDTEIKVDYITVGEPIVTDFEAVPLLGLAPLNVQFTDLSTGGLQELVRETKKSNNSKIIVNDNSRDIVSWEWDFDNNGSIDSYEQNPQWIYTETSLYTVTLKVSDGSNIGTETKTDYITVGEPIIVDFEADITLGSFPLDVQFTDLSSGGLDTSTREIEKANNTEIVETNNSRDIVIWEWDFDNDGVIDSNEQNPAYIYNSIGYYSVCLTVYDNINNSNTLTKEDYIVVNPDIEFSYQTDGVIESGISLLSEDVIYCAASGDCVYRFNNSGQIEYTLNVNGDIKSATTITPDHNVYIASTDYNLYSFNSNGVSNTGWPISLGAEATASVASDSVGNIYIGTQNGIFQAVAPDGVNIWSYNVGAPVHSSAVISSENTLYVINANGRLYAFDLNTITPGNVVYKWIIETNGAVSSTPALDDINNIYIANEDGQLIKINDDGINGNVVWTFESGSAIIESSPLVDSNYNVYFGCNDGRVYSVNDSGQLNWMSDEFDPIKSTGALFESDEIQSRIYIGSDNGKLYALSTDDGIVLWQFTSDSAIICPILYDTGKIYFGTVNGEILVINDPDISTGTIFRNTSIWSTFQGNNLRTGNQTDNMYSVDPENINNISYLMQNNPNPFYNITHISYSLPYPDKVKLQIYNLKGQLVKTLVDAHKPAGYYSVEWNAENMTSGIYFYKLSTKDKTFIKKMILLR